MMSRNRSIADLGRQARSPHAATAARAMERDGDPSGAWHRLHHRSGRDSRAVTRAGARSSARSRTRARSPASWSRGGPRRRRSRRGRAPHRDENRPAALDVDPGRGPVERSIVDDEGVQSTRTRASGSTADDSGLLLPDQLGALHGASGAHVHPASPPVLPELRPPANILPTAFSSRPQRARGSPWSIPGGAVDALARAGRSAS
jgi:hypothetical protein